MGESKFGALGNGLERDFDPRLARVFHAARPAPAHDDPIRPDELEKFAAALVLTRVEQTKPHTITAANTRIDLRDQHRTGVGAPPMRDALGRCDGIEYDLRPRLDAAYQRETRHRSFRRASSSLLSA